MGSSGRGSGHEFLVAYKITVPIYDYTVEFCNRWINKYSRTHDQMVQAARSATQNIAEGYRQRSLAQYIRLVGVSEGSLEELLKDYKAFLRQGGYNIWKKDRSKEKIGEIGEVWEVLRKTPILPENPDFPDLPKDREVAANFLVTLIHQALSLIEKLGNSLEEKHRREGGFTENLYKQRKKYRGY